MVSAHYESNRDELILLRVRQSGQRLHTSSYMNNRGQMKNRTEAPKAIQNKILILNGIKTEFTLESANRGVKRDILASFRYKGRDYEFFFSEEKD